MIQVAILAGGLGTRLGPMAAQMPKALVPVNGRPFLAHVLDLLRERGLTRILMCVGHHADQLELAFGNGSAAGVQLSWHRDGPQLLGTGGALRGALHLLEEEFLVLYGDTYLDIDYGAVVRAFRDSYKPALMTVFRNSGRFDASNVVYRGGKLLRYSKRDPTPEMDYIDYGLSALHREVVEELPSGGPLDLADLYSRLVAEGRMDAYEIHRRFYEIGTPAGLSETERYLRERAR
jgi:N-acetyl-alpha-D-muramate 1-phosphate uridylyltransferase